MIDRVRAARKSVLLYPELIAGLGRDPAAIDFLCGYARPTAIVSTKKQILQKARACGLITIFQIFMIDTQAFETGIQTARRLDCDAVEIMPGAIPHIIREVSSQLPLPTSENQSHRGGRRIHLPVGPLGLRENHFAQNHCRAS